MRKEINTKEILDFKSAMKILFEDMFMYDNINLIDKYSFSRELSKHAIIYAKEKWSIENEFKENHVDDIEESALKLVNDYFDKINHHIKTQDFTFSNTVTNYKKNMHVLLGTLKLIFPYKYYSIVTKAKSVFDTYTLEDAARHGLLHINSASYCLEFLNKPHDFFSAYSRVDWQDDYNTLKLSLYEKISDTKKHLSDLELIFQSIIKFPNGSVEAESFYDASKNSLIRNISLTKKENINPVIKHEKMENKEENDVLNQQGLNEMNQDDPEWGWNID